MSDSGKADRQHSQLVKLLTQQVTGLNLLAAAISDLARSNEALADAVFQADQELGEEEDGQGFDMAGNPVRVS